MMNFVSNFISSQIFLVSSHAAAALIYNVTTGLLGYLAGFNFVQ